MNFWCLYIRCKLNVLWSSGGSGNASGGASGAGGFGVGAGAGAAFAAAYVTGAAVTGAG